MILNVSGRTDIVAFYTPWFMNRLQEGFVDVRNPFYPKKVSRIYFKDVDLFVFCTKNPLPILPYLKEIQKPILFQITLTPYKSDLEPNVPDKKKIMDGILKISKVIGSENVSVRYDPILINNKYTIEYHKAAFRRMCMVLSGSVSSIIISFVDIYKNVEKNASVLKIKTLEEKDYEELCTFFSQVAKEFHLVVQSCFEGEKLTHYGILNIPCVSKDLALRMTGKKYKTWSARKCGCTEMVDIGAYNSCHHLCKYCYANYDEKKVSKNILKHNVNSSLLLGELNEDDEIKVRK